MDAALMTPVPAANRKTQAPTGAGAAPLPLTGAKREYRPRVNRASYFLKRS